MTEQMYQKLKLNVLMDSDSEKVWVSQEYNNGDFPFRFVVRLQYCDYWNSEWATNGKYYLMVQVASLEQAKGKIPDVMESGGFDQEEWDQMSESFKHYEVANYGIATTLFGKQSNNQKFLIKEAKQEIQKILMLFGFYMDRPQNALGTTGWDCISGNILRSVQ